MPSKNWDHLIGTAFGRWTVTAVRSITGSKAVADCTCLCGNTATKRINSLLTGNTKSCGCLKPESTRIRALRHGHTTGRKHSSTYDSWSAMIARCYNPANAKYSYYGGRGITVCDRWRDFTLFLEDLGERPLGLTLDRRDNEKGYKLDNCAWASRKHQSNNRRGTRITVLHGNSYTVAQLSEAFTIPYPRLIDRLNRGWSVEDAVTKARYVRPTL